MKYFLPFAGLLLSLPTQAQVTFDFQQVTANYPTQIAHFEGTRQSSLHFIDIDGDGIKDIITSGKTVTVGAPETIVYKCDASGNFTKFDAGDELVGHIESEPASADIDGDGDQDYFASGVLYENDGAGHFSVVEDFEFPSLTLSAAYFGDVNGDNAPDLMVTGKGAGNNLLGSLLMNDGNGNFSLVEEAPFIAVREGSVRMFDSDNDGDLDILISGAIIESESPFVLGATAHLYTNDGSGNFTLSPQEFVGARHSTSAIADVNNDGYQDIAISGALGNSFGSTTNIYLNNQDGSFTPLAGNDDFYGAAKGTVALADFDNDNDIDLLLTQAGSGTLRFYKNDGAAAFTETTDFSNFVTIHQSRIGVHDVDNDGDMDFVYSGYVANNEPLTRLCINDGTGYFSYAVGSIFDHGSVVESGDIDNDGDMDLIVLGRDFNYESQSRIYKNDGAGNFSLFDDNTLPKYRNSTVHLADLDGDNDLDLLFSGRHLGGGVQFTKLFLNDGTGVYTETDESPFPGMLYGSLDTADADGDGDLDVLITGDTPGNEHFANLFFNDGNANFTSPEEELFYGVEDSDAHFIDVEGDGDQDVIILGLNNQNDPQTSLYRNMGDGSFLHDDTNSEIFTDLRNGAISTGDIDNDGDMDIIIAGRPMFGYSLTEVYLNDGNGNFTEADDAINNNMSEGSLSLKDIDNDGDLDLLSVGGDSKIFINDGQGVFTHEESIVLFTSSSGNGLLEDFDGNNQIDIIISAESLTDDYHTRLYLNQSCLPNYGTDVIESCDPITWIDGNTYNEDNTTATHIIVGGSENGCDSIVNLQFDRVDIDTNVLLIEFEATCPQQNGASYQWVDCADDFAPIPGATSNSYTPPISGFYAVEVSINDCVSRSECIVIDYIGLEEEELAQVTLVPNPTSQQFAITLGDTKDVTIKIYNLVGETVYEQTGINSALHQVDFQAPAGIYMVDVISPNAHKQLKLIVQ